MGARVIFNIKQEEGNYIARQALGYGHLKSLVRMKIGS